MENTLTEEPFDRLVESLPPPLHPLDRASKVRLIQKGFLTKINFPASADADRDWERLQTACGFNYGQRMEIKNLLFPLQPKAEYSGLLPGETGFQRSKSFVGKDGRTHVTLLQELEWKCRTYKTIIMSSPAGTGKTSILEIFARSKLPDLNIVYVKMNQEQSSIATLVRFGLDLSKVRCKVDSCYDGKITVFLLDDAQLKYGEATLWDKMIAQESFTPNHIRFVVSATHYLESSNRSAVEFNSILEGAKIPIDHLLLSEEKSKSFLNSYLQFEFGFKDELIQIIANDCGGNIGALRIACDDINEAFRLCTNERLTYEVILSHYLSTEFLGKMSRCFGTDILSGLPPELMGVIRKLLFSHQKLQYQTLQTSLSFLASLVRRGILSYHEFKLSFMSPLAKRYFMSYFYPLRGSEVGTH